MVVAIGVDLASVEIGQALMGEAVWKLAAYVKSLGPGTGESQGGEGGGDQGAGREGGGKQAGGAQGD